MTTVLKIDSSLYSRQGQSSQLATRFVDVLRAQIPGLRVIERDLARDPVPHLDAERFNAFLAKPEARTLAQQGVAAYSDALIDELRRANILVLGLPMYNFGVPSQLKAYFDHVARAGVTFKYTEQGSVGLLQGKKAYVFATRGGAYVGTPRDTQTAYVRDFLGFLGISDVEFIHAEGLAFGPAPREASLARARDAIQNLLPPAKLAA